MTQLDTEKYKPDLALNLKTGELQELASVTNCRLSHGTSGRHGEIVTITPPRGSIMDSSTILLVAPDGEIYAQNKAIKDQVHALLKL